MTLTIVLAAFSVSVAVMLIGVAVFEVIAERRIHKENERRRAEYEASAQRAKWLGTQPPVPPNRLARR